MSVLVTGAEGFIGSHVVEALLADGHSVRALVQYNSFGSLGWLEELSDLSRVDIILGDVRDSGQMIEISDGADAICHLAALIAIPHSYDAPGSYLHTNVLGTHNMLEAARRNKISRFINTSTSEVYGSAQYVPMDENHPIQPQSPYSASKIAADALAQSYFNSFDFPLITIRPFNTFGPRQSMRAVIPSLCAQFIEQKSVVRVGSLDPRRDFTIASDTASAYVNAMKANSAWGEVINLGSGFDVSVGEIIEDIQLLTGYSPAIETDQMRVRPPGSEVVRLLSDNSKAKQLLGWSPSRFGREGFRQGLAETLEWLAARVSSGSISTDAYVK